MNWLPTGDQVLLKLQEKTDKTQSGIIIMTGTDDYRYADVVKTGPGLLHKLEIEFQCQLKKAMKL
jgi:co-chaperonin GroES (HSP10)